MNVNDLKPYTGTVYIDGQEFVGNVTSYDFRDHVNDMREYAKKNIVMKLNSPGEIDIMMTIDRITMLKVIGFWDWCLENCPSRKVKHLMKHGKNERVRFKNFKRAMHLIGNMLEEKEK